MSCYYDAYGLKYKDKNEIYDMALPRLLGFFDEFDIRATFFIVANDIANNKDSINEIINRKHKLASHSLTHKLPFSSLNTGGICYELTKSKKCIEETFNVKCIGFRTPGWDFYDGYYSLLHKCGYKYDSSVFPTIVLPGLKIVHKLKAKNKKSGFGQFSNILKPREPYIVNINNTDSIVEFPIATTSIFRLPFFGTFQLNAPWTITPFILLLKNNSFITYELHPIEFLDLNDNLPVEMSIQPGMKKTVEIKKNLYKKIFKKINGYGFEFSTIEKVLEA